MAEVSEDKILRVLIQLGLDKQTVEAARGDLGKIGDLIKRARAEGKVTEAQFKSLGKSLDDLVAKAKIKQLETLGNILPRLGYGLRDIGEALGSRELAQLGSLTAGVGQLVSSVGDLVKLAGQLKAMGGLGKVIGVGGAIAGGIAAGEGIYHALGGRQDVTFFNTIGKSIALFAGSIEGRLAGSVEVGREAVVRISRDMGLLEEATEDARRPVGDFIARMREAGLIRIEGRGGVDPVRARTEMREAFERGEEERRERESRALQGFVDYQADIAALEKRAGQERIDIINDASARMVAAQRQYEERRRVLVEGFAQANLAAEQEYYDRRAELAAGFGIEVQRMEEDHQRNMRRLAEDSQMRQRDLIASRDALGLKRERQSYETQRRRAEDDYQVQARRRSEDFARQIAQMEAAFRKQQETRQSDYEQQLAELEKQHEAEQIEIERDKKKRLDQLKLRLGDEKAELKRGFDQRLIDIGYYNELQRNAYKDWYTLVAQDFQDWIRTHPIDFRTLLPGYTGPVPGDDDDGLGGRQMGGYVSAGRWRLHDNEYVMNAATTRAAERMVGARLTQDRVLSSMAGAGARAVTCNFYGSWTEADKAWFRQSAREVVDARLREVIG